MFLQPVCQNFGYQLNGTVQRQIGLKSATTFGLSIFGTMSDVRVVDASNADFINVESLT